MKKKPATFEDAVEEALKDMLTKDLEPADRIKALAVSVRWAAVKARLVTREHGSGFDDPDLDDPADEKV